MVSLPQIFQDALILHSSKKGSSLNYKYQLYMDLLSVLYRIASINDTV